MSQIFKSKPSSIRFNILVVDDDSTSISIISAILRRWEYDVVKITQPVEALPTIRNQQNIDIVVTDLHMPEINGLELQQQINEEFPKLPVMIMSSDERENVIMNALACGVVFYMVKPLKPFEIANLWRYAVSSKIGKSVHIEEIGSFEGATVAKPSYDDDDAAVSASSVNQKNKNKKSAKRNKKTKNGLLIEGEGETVVSAPKKAKLAWNNSLHNRFLQAIRFIGFDKAVPLKILDFMNVPGLTRENVASHLQKYRIFLRKVAERGAGEASMNFTHRSKFAAAHSVMLLQEQLREKEEQMLRSSQHLASSYGVGLNGNLIGSAGFPSLGASSNNSMSQRGSPFANTTNPLYQADSGAIFGTGSMTGGVMNGANSNPMYQQNSQSRLDLNNGNIGASSFKGFGTLGLNPSYTSGLENMGAFNNNPYSNYERIGLGGVVGASHGPLNRINRNEVVGNRLIGNSAVQHSALKESSSSTGFANANYQVPLTFAGVDEQGNTPRLSPLLSQNNFSNNFDMNTAQPEQFDEGIDFGSLLFDPIDNQVSQQQGGEGTPNPNFGIGSGTQQAQRNPPINQSQNLYLLETFAVADNASSPWNDMTLEQLREIEQTLNTELSSNNTNANPLNENNQISSFNRNTNQVRESNQNNVNHYAHNGLINQTGNSPQEIGGLDDEFINSLLQDFSY